MTPSFLTIFCVSIASVLRPDCGFHLLRLLCAKNNKRHSVKPLVMSGRTAVFGAGARPGGNPLLSMAGFGDSSDDEWSDEEKETPIAGGYASNPAIRPPSQPPMQSPPIPRPPGPPPPPPRPFSDVKIASEGKRHTPTPPARSASVEQRPNSTTPNSQTPLPRPPPPKPRPPPPAGPSPLVKLPEPRESRPPSAASSVLTESDARIRFAVASEPVVDHPVTQFAHQSRMEISESPSASVAQLQPQSIPATPSSVAQSPATAAALHAGAPSAEPSGQNPFPTGTRATALEYPGRRPSAAPQPVERPLARSPSPSHARRASISPAAPPPAPATEHALIQSPTIPASEVNAQLLSTLAAERRKAPGSSFQSRPAGNPWLDKLKALAAACKRGEVSGSSDVKADEDEGSDGADHHSVFGTSADFAAADRSYRRVASVLTAIRKRRAARQAGATVSNSEVLAALSGRAVAADEGGSPQASSNSSGGFAPAQYAMPLQWSVDIASPGPAPAAFGGKPADLKAEPLTSSLSAIRDESTGYVNTPFSSVSPFTFGAVGHMSFDAVPAPAEDLVFSQIDLLERETHPIDTLRQRPQPPTFQQPLPFSQIAQSTSPTLNTSYDTGRASVVSTGTRLSHLLDDALNESVVYGAGGSIHVQPTQQFHARKGPHPVLPFDIAKPAPSLSAGSSVKRGPSPFDFPTSPDTSPPASVRAALNTSASMHGIVVRPLTGVKVAFEQLTMSPASKVDLHSELRTGLSPHEDTGPRSGAGHTDDQSAAGDVTLLPSVLVPEAARTAQTTAQSRESSSMPLKQSAALPSTVRDVLVFPLRADAYVMQLDVCRSQQRHQRTSVRCRHGQNQSQSRELQRPSVHAW